MTRAVPPQAAIPNNKAELRAVDMRVPAFAKDLDSVLTTADWARQRCQEENLISVSRTVFFAGMPPPRWSGWFPGLCTTLSPFLQT